MKSVWILGAAVATIAAACGGTVVFDDPDSEDGTGGSGAGNTSGGGNVSTQSGPGNPTATTGSTDPTTTTSTDVTVTVGTTGPGPGDGGAGPGPGPGPSGGGFGGDPGEGPGGVGGADNGPAVGGSGSSSSGCTDYFEVTNQYCYTREACSGLTFEVECENNGDGPYRCWCYQDAVFVGTCTEPDVPGCSPDGCCESFWLFKG
jgi:hypothetical protein